MSDELLRKLILDGNGWHDEDGPVIVDGFENGTTYPVRYHWKSGGDGAASAEGFIRDNYLPMEETIRIAARLLAESQGEAARLREGLVAAARWFEERAKQVGELGAPGSFGIRAALNGYAEKCWTVVGGPPVPIGMGEAGQGAGDRAQSGGEDGNRAREAWLILVQFAEGNGGHLGYSDSETCSCPRCRAERWLAAGKIPSDSAPAPKPAPIPTGMEPGHKPRAFAVVYSSYADDEVHALYKTRELAQAEATRLGGMWEVAEWVINDQPDDIEPQKG